MNNATNNAMNNATNNAMNNATNNAMGSTAENSQPYFFGGWGLGVVFCVLLASCAASNPQLDSGSKSQLDSGSKSESSDNQGAEPKVVVPAFLAGEDRDPVEVKLLPEIEWRRYRGWSQVTGFFDTFAHGKLVGRVFVTPEAAAVVYQSNRDLYEVGYLGTKDYPLASVVLLETFATIKRRGNKVQGPTFMMQKHAKGGEFRPGGWEFIVLNKPLGKVQARDVDSDIDTCRSCHELAKQRDYVYFYKK